MADKVQAFLDDEVLSQTHMAAINVVQVAVVDLVFGQGGDHPLGLVDWDRTIVVGMQDQHRPGPRRDVFDRRTKPPGMVPGDPRRDPTTGPVEFEQIVGAGNADRGAEIARLIFPAASRHKRTRPQCRGERHEMAPGRHAREIDPLAIELVLVRVGVDPADSAQQVLITSRCRRAGHQAVLDGQGEKTECGPLLYIDGHPQLAAVAIVPASAVHTEQHRMGTGGGGNGDIGEQSRAEDLAVDNGICRHDRTFLVSD